MAAISASLRHFPSRIADLGFSVVLPDDWIAHDLPAEEPDFGVAARLFPLAIVTARNAAMAFACAARPAYDDGSLHDWVWFLMRENDLQPRAIGPGEAGGHPAMVGEAGQDSDLGPMTVRFALLEDGGRMVHFSLTAPDAFDDIAKRIWFAALESFRLESPRGMSVAMHGTPDVGAPADEASPAPSGASDEENTFAMHALADTTESFDPEHPVNARLRNNGIGFVPNLISIDEEARSGTFAAGALMASVTIPFGWHIIDDTRRTLVFEPSGKTQVSLNLIPAGEGGTGAVLDEIEAATRHDYPAPEFVRGEYQGIAFLGVRNISADSEAIEQYHMLLPAPRGGGFVRARITTIPERRTEAGNLADLLLRSVTSPPVEEDETPPSDWRDLASWLTDRGRMDEMEKVLSANIDHIGFAASVAAQYRRRMQQHLATGDRNEAADAFRAASRWMDQYATSATSGGEGIALSRERDGFRSELVQAFGGDPGD